MFSFVQAGGGAIGSLLGGVLVQVVSWEWIFLINIPIGMTTILLATRLLAADSGIGVQGSADALGGILVTAGLMLTVYTIVTTADHGFASVHTLGFGALSLLLLTGFLVREKRASNPLLPLRIFGSRSVAASNATQLLLIAGMFGFLFFSTLYLQRSAGFDALQAGLGMVPVAVAIGAVSLGLSARLNIRFGERPVLLAGLLLIVLGLALLSRARVGGAFAVDVLSAQLLIGIGFGAAMPALITLGMSGATAADSGLASGLLNTSQQVGGALGLSVLAALAATTSAGLSAAGADQASALTGGYQLAFLVAAGFVLTSLAVAALALREPAQQTPSPARRGSEGGGSA